MQVKKIKIQNFRNYAKQEIEFDPKLTIFYGENAQGKTNILEALFLCGLGKSFRTNKEKEMIQLGKDFTTVEVDYQKSDREGTIKIEIADKKNVFLNGIKIKKLSEILGNLHLVIFTPEDINLLRGGPTLRRRFLDMMIGQLRPSYVYQVNMYLKVLEQRNNYLRQIKFENKSPELLEIWNEKLAQYGEKIYQYRAEFIQKIIQKMIGIHSKITQNKEEICLEYISDCKSKQDYLDILEKTKKVDLLRGYTTKGVHRDDFVIYINGRQVNIYGSQGQNRTVVLSLKLAELQVIFDEIGEYPILLLDDFMSELDNKRIKNFLENIEETQVIITCTNPIGIQESKLYFVEKGAIN